MEKTATKLILYTFAGAFVVYMAWTLFIPISRAIFYSSITWAQAFKGIFPDKLYWGVLFAFIFTIQVLITDMLTEKYRSKKEYPAKVTSMTIKASYFPWIVYVLCWGIATSEGMEGLAIIFFCWLIAAPYVLVTIPINDFILVQYYKKRQ